MSRQDTIEWPPICPDFTTLVMRLYKKSRLSKLFRTLDEGMWLEMQYNHFTTRLVSSKKRMEKKIEQLTIFFNLYHSTGSTSKYGVEITSITEYENMF